MRGTPGMLSAPFRHHILFHGSTLHVRPVIPAIRRFATSQPKAIFDGIDIPDLPFGGDAVPVAVPETDSSQATGHNGIPRLPSGSGAGTSNKQTRTHKPGWKLLLKATAFTIFRATAFTVFATVVGLIVMSKKLDYKLQSITPKRIMTKVKASFSARAQKRKASAKQEETKRTASVLSTGAEEQP